MVANCRTIHDTTGIPLALSAPLIAPRSPWLWIDSATVPAREGLGRRHSDRRSPPTGASSAVRSGAPGHRRRPRGAARGEREGDHSTQGTDAGIGGLPFWPTALMSLPPPSGICESWTLTSESSCTGISSGWKRIRGLMEWRSRVEGEALPHLRGTGEELPRHLSDSG